jgi:ABC-type multidrug transport system fused ATPase/permease subunit
MRRSGEKVMKASGNLAWRLIVAIQAMRTIRAFAREQLFEEQFEDASDHVYKSSILLARMQNLIPPLSETGYLGILGLIIIAANELSIPFAVTLVAVLQLYRLQPHMRELDSNLLALAGLESSLRHVGQMLDRSDKAYPTSGSVPFDGLKSELRFEDVTMSYGDSEEPSLVKATFSIPAGGLTAIVGPSGAGKTTIINLILRLYEPNSGAIFANGMPLAAFDRQSWLSRIAVAGQDIELIEATIADNIALGAPDATREEIAEAAGLAGVTEFIPEGPDGLDLWVGDRGLSLSGGQRQRVSLARALIRRPDILILDEAMSALNDELAEEIRKNAAKVMRGKTTILITHRMDVALEADHVIWLNDGRTVEVTSDHAASSAERPRDQAI